MKLRERLGNRDGQLRRRLILLATFSAPLILCVAMASWLMEHELENLRQSVTAEVKQVVFQAKQDELAHFVQAGRKVIAHYCEQGKTDPRARDEGRELLRKMDFGTKADDNYFFVYELDGTVVMHPRLPIEGQNLWDKKDQAGALIIQKLIAQAKAGGGFVEYLWNRPSTTRDELKLGYVELVPECNWMIGTGLYLDTLGDIELIIQTITTNKIRSTREKIFLIALVALLLVAAGGLVVNLNEQRSAFERLRAMAQKVVQAQETERTRVALELHDGISQILASAKFVFESVVIRLTRGSTGGLETDLNLGLDQLRTAMHDVRRISHDLYPTLLDDAGLGSALEQLSREFSDRTGIKVNVSIDKVPTIQREAARSLYRFAQQAMGNVEAHARATLVTLTLRWNRGISLEVVDNGIGFSAKPKPDRPREGLGLTSMRERIEMLGGSFALHSEPQNTQLKAYLPPESVKP